MIDSFWSLLRVPVFNELRKSYSVVQNWHHNELYGIDDVRLVTKGFLDEFVKPLLPDSSENDIILISPQYPKEAIEVLRGVGLTQLGTEEVLWLVHVDVDTD